MARILLRIVRALFALFGMALVSGDLAHLYVTAGPAGRPYAAMFGLMTLALVWAVCYWALPCMAREVLPAWRRYRSSGRSSRTHPAPAGRAPADGPGSAVPVAAPGPEPIGGATMARKHGGWGVLRTAPKGCGVPGGATYPALMALATGRVLYRDGADRLLVWHPVSPTADPAEPRDYPTGAPALARVRSGDSSGLVTLSATDAASRILTARERAASRAAEPVAPAPKPVAPKPAPSAVAPKPTPEPDGLPRTALTLASLAGIPSGATASDARAVLTGAGIPEGSADGIVRDLLSAGYVVADPAPEPEPAPVVITDPADLAGIVTMAVLSALSAVGIVRSVPAPAPVAPAVPTPEPVPVATVAPAPKPARGKPAKGTPLTLARMASVRLAGGRTSDPARDLATIREHWGSVPEPDRLAIRKRLRDAGITFRAPKG